MTASLMYTRAWSNTSLDAMVAWARNNRTQSLTRVTGGFLVFPGAVSAAALAEATFHVERRHAFVGRLEHADKDELFGLTDPRHSTIYPVTQLTGGYALDVADTSMLKLSVGVAGTISRVPADLRAVYGDLTGTLGFLRVSVH
jgi:hypothetical protein